MSLLIPSNITTVNLIIIFNRLAYTALTDIFQRFVFHLVDIDIHLSFQRLLFVFHLVDINIHLSFQRLLFVFYLVEIDIHLSFQRLLFVLCSILDTICTYCSSRSRINTSLVRVNLWDCAVIFYDLCHYE